jgi:hypothetical protein
VIPVRPWRRRLATTFAGLLAVSLGVLTIPGVAHAGPNEGDIFSAVNAARASAGLPGYAYAGDLAAAARGQAERMAASGELYHNPNLGSEVGGWSRIGENVAFAGDWRAAHDVLMNSPDHRAQILDSGFTQMGVGTAVGDDGTIWVAEVFRTPTGAAAPSGGSGGSEGTPGTSTSAPTTSTSSGSVPTAAPPEPTPEQLLRQNIREAREKLADRQKQRKGNDPIVAVLDFTTVMDTVTG